MSSSIYPTTNLSLYNVSSISLFNTKPVPKPVPTPLYGDYHVYSNSTKTDANINHIKSVKHINNGLESYKYQCRRLQDKEGVNLPKLLENDENIQQVLIELIKKQNKINCCDNIDLSKYVLKTSIAPCSETIPEKYKKYGRNYNLSDNKEKKEESNAHKVHPQRISDKFSLGFISLTTLIVLIIIMNVM